MTHIDLGDLKQELTDEAKNLGLTLSAYIRIILINRPKIMFGDKKNFK